VICQSCGQISLPCLECERYPWAAQKNIKPGDKYLIIPPLETFRPHIIEGHKWDGSDFLYGGVEVGFFAPIVSKRVIDFLQSRHSTSFLARPVDIAVDRMTPEQLKRLKEVSRLVS
jgi:hypothetical protein